MSLCISSCDFAFASRYQFCTDFSKELRVVESRLEAGRHCWMLWHWVLKLQPGIWWICSKVGQVLDSRFPHLPLEPWECWVSIEVFSIIFQFVSVSLEFLICFHAWSCFLFGFSMILISFEAMKAAFEEFVANWSSRIEAGIVFQSLRVNLRRLAIPAKVWKIEAWRNRLRFLSVLRGISVFLILNLQGWSSHLRRWHPKLHHRCGISENMKETYSKNICRKNLEPPSYINNSVRCNGVFPPMLLHSFIMRLQWLSPTSRACTVRRTGDFRVGSRFPILLEQFFSQNCALLMLSCWNATYKSQMQQLFEAPASYKDNIFISWSIQKLKPWMFVKVAFRFLLGNDWLSQLMARCC